MPPRCRVSYQGEPGAYSEKATFQFLGEDIETVGLNSFEDVFKSVISGNCDYAMLPFENSLGGSIHANYDLLLRYDLHIVGEHSFRVEHCLLALPGTRREDIKHVMSHPQALAQVDGYLRKWAAEGQDVRPRVGEDTAGSAKMISEQPDTLGKDHAAVASDLAAKHYGLEVLNRNIEDSDSNFTRFLLLSRSPDTREVRMLGQKTSVVFSLREDQAGALFKALSAFAVRDIDLSKIESRPAKPDLLLRVSGANPRTKSASHDDTSFPAPPLRQQPEWLQEVNASSKGSTIINVAGKAEREDGAGDDKVAKKKGKPGQKQPKFKYLFYLDALASTQDQNLRNAMRHLCELAPLVWLLGCYPAGNNQEIPIQLPMPPDRQALGIGAPVSVSAAAQASPSPSAAATGASAGAGTDAGADTGAGASAAAGAAGAAGAAAGAGVGAGRALRIGIIGFGNFGQFMGRALRKAGHEVMATNYHDESAKATEMGIRYFPWMDVESLLRGGDGGLGYLPSPTATAAAGVAEKEQPSAEKGGSRLDVLLIAVSILSFQKVVADLKQQGLLALTRGVLVVEVLSVKSMPKTAMLQMLPAEAGILCTHPMFGPESGKHSWVGLPFLYEQVRVPLWGEAYRPGSVHAKVQAACAAFLEFFRQEGCKMVEMGCELHDQYAAGSQFVTHLTGRVLATQRLQPTPIDTKGFQSLLGVIDTTCKDSFDLFYGLYRHNASSNDQLKGLERGLAEVKRLLELHDTKLLSDAAEVTNHEETADEEAGESKAGEAKAKRRKTK